MGQSLFISPRSLKKKEPTLYSLALDALLASPLVSAGRLPQPAPIIELDVTYQEHLNGLAAEVKKHVPHLDGVVHSIGFAPEAALGGNFLNTTWEDVATAVHISAYSLKSLTMACKPTFKDGASVVGLDFDAQVAWPKYDWMGVAKAALESTSRYLARDLGTETFVSTLSLQDPFAPWLQNRFRVLMNLKRYGMNAVRSDGMSAGSRTCRQAQSCSCAVKRLVPRDHRGDHPVSMAGYMEWAHNSAIYARIFHSQPLQVALTPRPETPSYCRGPPLPPTTASAGFVSR
jgi:hypothetical protein